MPVIRYMASALLYLLMLPISTPAAFKQLTRVVNVFEIKKKV